MKIEIRNLKKVFGTKTAVDIEKATSMTGRFSDSWETTERERPRSSASFSTF